MFKKCCMNKAEFRWTGEAATVREGCCHSGCCDWWNGLIPPSLSLLHCLSLMQKTCSCHVNLFKCEFSDLRGLGICKLSSSVSYLHRLFQSITWVESSTNTSMEHSWINNKQKSVCFRGLSTQLVGWRSRCRTSADSMGWSSARQPTVRLQCPGELCGPQTPLQLWCRPHCMVLCSLSFH